MTPSWFRKVFKKRELLLLIVTGKSIIEKQNSEISPESFVKMKYFAWQSVFIDRTPIDEKKNHIFRDLKTELINWTKK